MPRDLTQKQFERALEAEGFERLPGPLPYFRDTTGRISRDTHVGGIVNPTTWRIMRRATLANLIQRRKAEHA